MTTRSIKIQAKLVSTNTQPITKLCIAAWDKNMIVDDFVGSSETKAEDFFDIRFIRKTTGQHLQNLAK